MLKLNHIYTGDASTTLGRFPNESVDCIVTSPPYYGLRNYGVNGQIGLEQTPEQYIERLINVFSECKRALKKDGTMWIVIGDSYAGSGRGKGDINKKGKQQKASYTGDFVKPYHLCGYKSKDLMGIPWMLAFALRADGWYLRQDIIWHKPNPMPESVKDRCTKSHEYLFLLTKSPRYYFNHEAMLEPANYDGRKKMVHNGCKKYNSASEIAPQGIFKGGKNRWANPPRGYAEKDGQTGQAEQHHGVNIAGHGFVRNKRSVWTVPTRGFKGSHFATFPPELIRPCIASGCPPNGVVLDPFMGAGTTAIVALELNRDYVGVELNDKYVKIAEDRLLFKRG